MVDAKKKIQCEETQRFSNMETVWVENNTEIGEVCGLVIFML